MPRVATGGSVRRRTETGPSPPSGPVKVKNLSTATSSGQPEAAGETLTSCFGAVGIKRLY